MWVRMGDFASKPMQDFSPRTGNGLAMTSFLLRTNWETRKRSCSWWCLEDNTSQTAAPEDAFPGRESLMLSERPESFTPNLGVLLGLPWCFLQCISISQVFCLHPGQGCSARGSGPLCPRAGQTEQGWGCWGGAQGWAPPGNGLWLLGEDRRGTGTRGLRNRELLESKHPASQIPRPNIQKSLHPFQNPSQL